MSEPACYVDIACNDPHSGRFTGKAPAFTFECSDAEVAVDGDIFEGIDIAFDGQWALLIGGERYSFTSQRQWVGNWCWNRFAMSVDDARRLLEQLFRAGYQLEQWDDDAGVFAELVARSERGDFKQPEASSA